MKDLKKLGNVGYLLELRVGKNNKITCACFRNNVYHLTKHSTFVQTIHFWLANNENFILLRKASAIASFRQLGPVLKKSNSGIQRLIREREFNAQQMIWVESWTSRRFHVSLLRVPLKIIIIIWAVTASGVRQLGLGAARRSDKLGIRYLLLRDCSRQFSGYEQTFILILYRHKWTGVIVTIVS